MMLPEQITSVSHDSQPHYVFNDLHVCEICSNPLFPIGSSGTCDVCLDWLADLGVYKGPLSWVRDLIKVQ